MEHCSNCRFFIKDNSLCYLIDPPEVSPNGWCEYHVKGEPIEKDISPTKKISAERANYTEK